jgi:kumamolisin
MGRGLRVRSRAMLVAGLMLASLLAPATALARSTAVGPAPAAAQLTLVVPLVADDAGLRRFALAVSTPGSPLYGQFAPVSELAARFGAKPAAAAIVVRYLRGLGAHGVQLSPTRMFVQASLSVAMAERTFGARLALMRDSGGSQFVAPRAPSAGLPPALRGLATGVVGLDTQPLEARAQLQSLHGAWRVAAGPPRAPDQTPSGYEPRTGTPAGCAGGVNTNGFTPKQYLTAYDYDALHNAGLRGAGERVALIEIDGFRSSDVATFGSCFGIHIPRIRTYTVGFRHPLAPGGETTLDLEVLSAAAPKLASIDVYENSGDAAHVLQAFSAPLTATGPAPQVISASLGICEPFLYAAAGPAGIQAVERDLELAASSGITVLAAAGDQGSSACVKDDGSVVPMLAVSYPASSWWVTAVGGTNFDLNAANQITGEQAWNDAQLHPSAGGGGLSVLPFGRPPYQHSVVSLNVRAVPDVSLLADLAPGYAIYCTASGDPTCGGWGAVGGTSAASPLLAGGLALVDQELAQRHREPLGLVNPVIYALAGSSLGSTIFHDVSSGDNDLGQWLPADSNHPSGQALGCCTAAAGYDEATGWGSLDLGAFDQAALAIMPAAPAVSLSLLPGQHPLRAHAIYARLGCSASCRAYVGGFLVFGSGNFVLYSSFRHVGRRGTHVFRIALNARDLQKARAALAAHRPAYAVLSGIAIDGQGRPLAASRHKVLYLRG